MIIVTGGAGFIGSSLVRGLNEKGYEDILIADNLKKSEKHLNLNRLKFRDFMQKEDLPLFLNKLGKIDAFFHQGACSDTMENDGVYMIKNNYEYSKELFSFCAEKNIKFIYASSASVYGNGENGFSEKPECEYPLNVYAFSKYLFDRYVRINSGRTDNQVTGLRYFNVYGPQENHKNRMASVFYHFYNQAKKTGVINVFEGSRDFIRDFISAGDVVKVNIHFLENNISGIFNCGTGKSRSFFEVAEAVKAQFDNSGSCNSDAVMIEEVEFPASLKGKYQKYTCADLSDLREKGGYRADFCSIEKGMMQYYELLEKSGGYYI